MNSCMERKRPRTEGELPTSHNAKTRRLDSASNVACADSRRMIERCVRRYNWSLDYGNGVFEAYWIFLGFKKAIDDWDGTKLAAPLPIDRMWRDALLDTRKYSQDCVTMFGRMIHYNPDRNFDEPARKARFERTLTIVKLRFGANGYDRKIWQFGTLDTTNPVNGLPSLDPCSKSSHTVGCTTKSLCKSSNTMTQPTVCTRGDSEFPAPPAVVSPSPNVVFETIAKPAPTTTAMDRLASICAAKAVATHEERSSSDVPPADLIQDHPPTAETRLSKNVTCTQPDEDTYDCDNDSTSLPPWHNNESDEDFSHDAVARLSSPMTNAIKVSNTLPIRQETFTKSTAITASVGDPDSTNENLKAAVVASPSRPTMPPAFRITTIGKATSATDCVMVRVEKRGSTNAYFKISRLVKLRELFDEYERQAGFHNCSVLFSYNGSEIFPRQTPAMIGMYSFGVIYASKGKRRSSKSFP